VRAVDVYQFHVSSWFFSDIASAKFLWGSSMRKFDARRPVIAPPTPTVHMPPPAAVFHRSAARESCMIRHVRTSWAISIWFRTRLPCSSASVPAYDARMMRRRGSCSKSQIGL
jgi:hypothetical protein